MALRLTSGRAAHRCPSLRESGHGERPCPHLAPASTYSYAVFGRTFPMLSPRLAQITLDRERGHALAAAEFDHEEGPGDYVPDELLERRSRPR